MECYPANLLTQCFINYDPAMHRLDPWLDVMQQKRNRKHINNSVSITPEISTVLSLSLESLDDRRKDILLLRYRDGKTLRECGEKYNISAERVRQLARTAIQHIKKQAGDILISAIWTNTPQPTTTDWLIWIVKQCKDHNGSYKTYASIPIECKQLLLTKVSNDAQYVYNKAVKDE